jgi:hypothetical protein
MDREIVVIFLFFNTPVLTAVKRIILVGRIITDDWERCDK